MGRSIPYKLIKNYIVNVLKARYLKNPVLKPLIFAYYITFNCNFKCTYCNFVKTGQIKNYHDQLNTEDTLKFLKIINQACPNIYFSGGEPLLRNDIVEILKECKQLGFESITLISNMSLIHKKLEVLDYVTNLVASLDMIDEKKYVKILGVPISVVKQLKKNIIECSKLQKEKNFCLICNFVANDETVPHAREVMDFCFQHNIRFSLCPQALSGGKIGFDAINNEEYQRLIKHIIRERKENKLILGSRYYLNTISKLTQFDCYPTLSPRVYPNGDFFYPCHPFASIASNLFEIGSYNESLKIGINKFGPTPKCKGKCYMSCYIELANYIKHPVAGIRELLHLKAFPIKLKGIIKYGK